MFFLYRLPVLLVLPQFLLVPENWLSLTLDKNATDANERETVG